MLLFVSITSLGQVSYRVGLDADNKTYRLYMKSAVGYTGIQAKISTAQMTIVVPHGTGNDYFQPTNIKGKLAGTNQMSWGATRVDKPNENQLSDYISFGFSGSGSQVLFDIIANQEIELLNFQNAGSCVGTVNLISNTDPFLAPNSQNTNPGNQMTILGYGTSNAYSSNYGGGANCQTSFPDLTVGISGSSNITAGINTNYTISVNNIGTDVSNGQITVSTTLPVGVSYNSFSGAGWSVSSAIQSNGSTIVTASTNNVVAINGSLSQLVLNVTASESIGNGNSITISSLLSGGEDNNLTNNSASTNSLVTVNSPNLSLAMNGPSTINPNQSANYTLNISNIGNSASVGTVTANITIPNGLSYNSFTGNGWVYGSSTLQNGGAILLTFTNTNVINANTSANALILNLTAGSNTSNNMVLPVVAAVSGGGDNTNSNNVSSVNTTVIIGSVANLALNISGPSSIIAGVSSSFTINVSNTGTAATDGQIVTTSILPVGFIYNSFVGAGWSVVATAQGNGTTLLTSTYNGIITAGGAATPLVINTITQSSLGTGTTYIIGNTLSGGGTIGSISSNYNVIVNAAANLSLVINGINNINAGGTGSYVFTLSNNGSTPSSGIITNTITLPAGVNYSSFTGNGWIFVNAVPQLNGTTLVTFTYNNNIAGNSSASSLSLNLSFANNLTINSSIIINSIITGTGINTNSSITLIVGSSPIPDLQLSINGTTVTNPNGLASYTINVSNTGTTTSNGPISVSLLIPNGLSYTSFTGSGWSYGSSTLQTGGAILVTFTTNNIINAGASNNSLVVNLTAGANVVNNTIFTIPGNVSGGGETNTGNNSSSANLTIITQGGPILTATINGVLNVDINYSYNYTINVNNIGTAATTGTTTVTTVLPIGVFYNSTSGNGWISVAIPQPNGTTLVVSTYNGIIEANGVANQLILNITPSGILTAGSIIILNGSVTGGGATNINNTFFTNIIVNNSSLTADLGVSVNISNNTPNLNQTVNYTFTVINNGNGTPNNVQTLISLPAGFVVTNFSTTNGGYDINSRIWNVGTISVGQTFTLNISGYATIEGIDFAIISLINTSLQDNRAFNNIAKVCYATPVSICTGEGYVAYLGKQNTNIQWFKNGSQINNATADSLFITTAGSYSATYTNSCGELVITPAVTVITGTVPNAPIITANKTAICGNELVQLTASSCGLGKVLWSTGATTSTININTAGTYTASCVNGCGTSQPSTPLIISNNCQNAGKIGDYVWYDNNNNGKQDSNESGVKNVRLELYKDGVFTGLSTSTDSTGKYLFSNLTTGNYQVKILPISLPAKYYLSKKPNAATVADSLDSDFDNYTGFSPVININTSIPSQSVNLTIDGGIFLKPEADISDPCRCFGVEYTLDEKKELFETVTVNGPTNDTWRVIAQTGMLALDTLVKRPVLIGTLLTEVSPGKYQINFTHEDNIGYTVKVSNGIDTLSMSNFCSIYPQLTATKLNQTVCRNAPPIPLSATMNLPGTAQFYYIDKLTQQKVIITQFDPKKFTSGETVYIKIDVTPADGRLCTYVITQTVNISVFDCSTECKPIICVPLTIAKTKN
ncbi:hypothetical protein GCM10011514_52830 [Emticicia aquatilis]|uniref:Ig-like domain-containing protein n=2 Tax=Emticicia aquatilis TaxID=1537369 RepID=A0A917DZN5_9BACT|nr:hypothetical protein GCM10011514_52830 [Emticicia aquatilis]